MAREIFNLRLSFGITILIIVQSGLYAQSSWKQKMETSVHVDSSIVYAENWRKESSKNKNLSDYLDASLQLANKFGYAGYFVRSESILDTLKSDLRFKSPEDRSRVFLEFGSLYNAMSLPDSALSNMRRAESITRKNQLWGLLIKSKIDMGELFRKTGRFPEAEAVLEEAHNLYETKAVNNPNQKVRIFDRLAAVYNETNRAEIAVVYSRKALKICKENHLDNKLTYQYNELGAAFRNRKVFDSSEYYFKMAAEVSKENGQIMEELLALRNLGSLYGRFEFPKEKSMGIFRQVIERQEETKVPFDLTQVYYYLSLDLESLGRYKESLKYRCLFYEGLHKTETRENDIQFINATEKYKSELLKNELSNVETELDGTKTQLESETKKVRIIFANIIVVGLILLLIVILLVVINRKRLELDRELEKKQALIQEVHHRTKNNIQFINSLVNLQIKSQKDTEEKAPLKDVSRRIQAMGLVHEMLYSKDDFEGIDISNYITNLIDYQKNFIQSKNKMATFSADIDHISCDISTATSIGIIISECIANSFEHAFAEIPNPKIAIACKEKGKSVELLYSDNGCGVENDEVLQGKKSLGTRLIDIFVRQLGGEYEFKSIKNEGFRLRVTFDKSN